MINSDKSYQDAVKHNLQEFSWERQNWRFAMWNEEAADRMDKFTTDKQVLDLGCGDGVAIDRFNELGYKCIGVDINQDKLSQVKAPTACRDFLTYLRGLPAASVPNIFCHHALEHVPNPRQILDEVTRVLKPGGVWFCIVPHEDNHSLRGTHYTVFEDASELLPPGLEVLTAELLTRETKEHLMVAQK